MSMLNKLKASLGIGAAVVDTVIDQDTYKQGETISGLVKVTGGKVSQQINRIELRLMATVVVEGEDSEYLDEHTLWNQTVSERVVLEPGYEWAESFSFDLPKHTPITSETMKVWIRTTVDIAKGIDPVDVDPITILPANEAASLLKAIESLGFVCKKVITKWKDTSENEAVQQFEWIPETGFFKENLDRLIAAFTPEKEGFHVAFKIDRHLTGVGGRIAEHLDADESKHELFIKNEQFQADLEQLVQKIEQSLRSAI